MAGFRIEGNVSGNVAEVTTSNELKTTLPANQSNAGFASITNLTRGVYNNAIEITEEGAVYVTQTYQILDLNFNSAATNWGAKLGTNATTLTKAPTNGFMRLNSGSVTTINTGISIYSNKTFMVQEGAELLVKMYLKHTNASATNKQFDLGLGYYAFASGQAAQMNEFIGFRWTTTGGLLAVVATSFGGAPTEQTLQLNGNLPYSDSVTREYELVITESKVHFYVAGTYLGTILKDPASWGLAKAVSLPFIARLFIGASAASAAPVFDIGAISLKKAGTFDNLSVEKVQAGQGSSSYYFQPDLGASAATHNIPASGTAPTAGTGSNTASAANNTAVLGGLIRQTLTGVTATLSSNILWTGYQNPVYPTTSGQATNARNFIVTGISISPMVVTTALAGGGFTVTWFAAIGSTALSLATTDTDGTTAVAQKSPRYVPLPLVSTLPATAALGIVSTDVGDHQFVFPTPLVVHPGEFISIAMRTVAVTAAVTAGTADIMIGINGYWE